MKLVIEPVVPQPTRKGEWWYWGPKLPGHAKRYHHAGLELAGDLAFNAPHRPGDPLDDGVVERVEARQGRHVTYDDMRAAGMENPERGKVLGEPANVGPWEYEWDRKHPDRPWDLDDWYWLFWLRED